MAASEPELLRWGSGRMIDLGGSRPWDFCSVMAAADDIHREVPK